MSFEAALSYRELGLLRLAHGRKGDRERAEASLRQARALFQDVGSRRLVAEVDGLLDALGRDCAPSPRAGALSGREREVADLVAAGFSNRRIARRLVISEKTAAHHVGSILNKLGFGTRAEIAAYVARQPVAPGTPAINR
jgi:DNA-binding CsgD family transcriptional regulator